jgi:hypothetical protein
MVDRCRFPRGGVVLIMTLMTSSIAARWAAVTIIMVRSWWSNPSPIALIISMSA